MTLKLSFPAVEEIDPVYITDQEEWVGVFCTPARERLAGRAPVAMRHPITGAMVTTCGSPLCLCAAKGKVARYATFEEAEAWREGLRQKAKVELYNL
jgi:hypothetical protein